MQNERKRILNMLENGTITTDEALTLLENLSQTDSPAAPSDPPADNTASTQKEEQTNDEQPQDKSSEQSKEDAQDKGTSGKFGWSGTSADDFMEDIRKDLTHVGDQFMQFMQSAVQKVKEFDMDNPFGTAVAFTHTIEKSGKDINEIIADIDNGKCSIAPGEGEDITGTFSVKVFTSGSEEEAKQDFLEKLIFMTDGPTLRVSSNSKTVQVNMVLTVPKKMYHKISVRLLNGGLEARNLEAENLRVKTANGKVNMSYVHTETARIETLNGEIRLLSFDSTQLETQTLNGLIYVDGKVKETQSHTLNGPISITTTHERPEKIDAKSVGGNIELYAPSSLSLIGDVSSTIGSLNIKLPDVEKSSDEDQLLHRSITFKKKVEASPTELHLFAESKTGSVLVCYTPEKDA